MESLKSSALKLNNRLDKPIRPVFVHPDSRSFPDFRDSEIDFYPVICVSSSRYVPDQIERQPWGDYVQGSGDDHELWSKGLTPQVFWNNVDEIVNCPSNELDELITTLMNESDNEMISNEIVINKNYLKGTLYPCSSIPPPSSNTAFISLTPEISSNVPKHTLHIKLSESSKKAQKKFLSSLDVIINFIRKQLEENRMVAVTDSDNGTDLASTVCTAAATLFYEENERPSSMLTSGQRPQSELLFFIFSKLLLILFKNQLIKIFHSY